MGLFDDPFVDEKQAVQLVASSEHTGLAREVARQSIVLLKNKDKLLPLKKDIRTLAVIGPNADNVYNMLGDYTAPQADGTVVTVLMEFDKRSLKKLVCCMPKGVQCVILPYRI